MLKIARQNWNRMHHKLRIGNSSITITCLFHAKKRPMSCEKYNKTKSNDLERDYLEPIRRHNEANSAKNEDKLRAINDTSFVSATFDLQSVLQIPSSDVSEMYYSRKLCAYNLTIYESAPPNSAHCFAWTKINGQRGSSEIGTSLYTWIKALPDNIKEISQFSDTCSG